MFVSPVFLPNSTLEKGDEFTSIDGVEICNKYIVPIKRVQGQQRPSVSKMFHRHWDTKQLMRELDSIPDAAVCWIEEKIHGTSGRTGNVLVDTKRPWWKFWAPKEEWKVVSGTRRVDNTNYHLPAIRQEIERRVATLLHKGETIFYEIYGYDGGKHIQAGYPYDCRGGEWKCVLYRVTITIPDGFSLDYNRQQVYRRAEQLGLEKPYLFGSTHKPDLIDDVIQRYEGRSAIDQGTLKEGVVIWFVDKFGKWTCLKHKSPEFLLDQDKKMEKGQGDIEDNI